MRSIAFNSAGGGAMLRAAKVCRSGSRSIKRSISAPGLREICPPSGKICFCSSSDNLRDAVRIGQIAGAGVPGPQHRVVLDEALTLFDQAAMFRLCDASLRGLTDGPLASLADQARSALGRRDVQSIRRAASDIQEAAPEDALARAISGALQVASLVMEGKGR